MPGLQRDAAREVQSLAGENTRVGKPTAAQTVRLDQKRTHGQPRCPVAWSR